MATWPLENVYTVEEVGQSQQTAETMVVEDNRRFPLLRFRSALHCGYSGITDIQDGLFFVLTRARTFKKS
jgi:hypothetical protein